MASNLKKKLGKKKDNFPDNNYVIQKLPFFKVAKCEDYFQHHLRAPSYSLLLKWGKGLKMSASDIEDTSQRFHLRNKLGRLFCRKYTIHNSLFVFPSFFQDQILDI